MNPSNLIKYSVELTDTFGGDANYSWVRRCDFLAPSNASNALLMRRAKKLVGINGERGKTSSYGSMLLEFRPFGACVVMFINTSH